MGPQKPKGIHSGGHSGRCHQFRSKYLLSPTRSERSIDPDDYNVDTGL